MYHLPHTRTCAKSVEAVLSFAVSFVRRLLARLTAGRSRLRDGRIGRRTHSAHLLLTSAQFDLIGHEALAFHDDLALCALTADVRAIGFVAENEGDLDAKKEAGSHQGRDEESP